MHWSVGWLVVSAAGFTLQQGGCVACVILLGRLIGWLYLPLVVAEFVCQRPLRHLCTEQIYFILFLIFILNIIIFLLHYYVLSYIGCGLPIFSEC